MKPWELLTREEKENYVFSHVHNDYKGVTNRVRSILVCRGATMIVALSELTDDEINFYQTSYKKGR